MSIYKNDIYTMSNYFIPLFSENYRGTSIKCNFLDTIFALIQMYMQSYNDYFNLRLFSYTTIYTNLTEDK